jgi:hypothetical protein
VTLTVIVTCTTVTVEFILQLKAIALDMNWSAIVSPVSAITRIFLKIVVISAVLTAILIEFRLAIL